MKVKLFIVMLLIGLVALPSCSDSYQDEIDTEQSYLFLEVFENKYYCKEQNSTIEFIHYYQYPDKNEFITVCRMYGDIIQNWHEDTVTVSVDVKNDIISNNTNVRFEIVNKNLLIGSLRVEGNWLKQ